MSDMTNNVTIYQCDDKCQSLIACRTAGRRRPRGRGGCTRGRQDRKSTRLNSSHEWISYAVFCLKKKNILIKNSFLGSSDSLVFSELLHSLAPRTLAADPIPDFV